MNEQEKDRTASLYEHYLKHGSPRIGLNAAAAQVAAILTLADTINTAGIVIARAVREKR
jgi:hypothetical protein